jgi:hypothetical protein
MLMSKAIYFFLFLTCCESTILNICVQPSWPSWYPLLVAYLELYFLDWTVQCLVFWRPFKLFSKMMYSDLFSPVVYQGSFHALSLFCQTCVILQCLIVDGKYDLVGGPWFDLRVFFLQIRHSIPWEMPPVLVAIVFLMCVLPESLVVLVCKLNLPDLRSQPFK